MAETSGVAAMDFFDTIQDMMDSNGRWDEFAGWKADSEKLKQLVPYHQTTYVRVSWANHFCQGEILALVAQKIGHHHLYHLHIQFRSTKLPKTGSVHISQLSI